MANAGMGRAYAVIHEVLRDTCTPGARINAKAVDEEIARRTTQEGITHYNVSCCTATARKSAHYCGFCKRAGGFAVSPDGRYVNGSEGMFGVPWHASLGGTVATNIGVGRGNGNRIAVTRAPMPSREDYQPSGVAPRSISMSDPLAGFGWTTLLARYDKTASRGYDPKSEHLRGCRLTTNDRDLYYQLVTKAAPETRPQLGADWYEALLYWKLYSQPAAVSNITSWLKGFAPERLRQFLADTPKTIPRKVSDVVELVELAGKYQIPGMKGSTALPVRTTFLHILYPDVIPIFDKMVLKAVGAWREGANHDITVLRQYIPHAWALADKHTQQLSGFKESPVRLVDMALWVKRSST